MPWFRPIFLIKIVSAPFWDFSIKRRKKDHFFNARLQYLIIFYMVKYKKIKIKLIIYERHFSLGPPSGPWSRINHHTKYYPSLPPFCERILWMAPNPKNQKPIKLLNDSFHVIHFINENFSQIFFFCFFFFVFIKLLIFKCSQ